MKPEDAPNLVNNPIGWSRSAIITATFGALWGAWGSAGLGRPGILLWVFILVGALLVAFGVRQVSRLRALGLPPVASPFRFPAYRYAVLFEAVAIPIACLWLVRERRYDLLAPVTALIVGLHFIGLAKAFHSRRYIGVCAAMVLLAAGTVVLLPAVGNGRSPVHIWLLVTGWGCAAILWAVTVQNLWRARRYDTGPATASTAQLK
ncbi:MAG TPA: hypothetical protein VFC10_08335 [Terriglobia bacterium]|nr:hypothetical protein [Terriglobia bacterium]